MGQNQTEVLTLDSVEIGFATGKSGRRLLPPLSASACKGELVAVIGRNGIGKSTLLKTLTGIHPLLGGNIYVRRRNISDLSRKELAQEIGYVSTEIVKVSNMSVYELVALGRFPHTNWIGRISRHDDGVIMDAIGNTGLTDLSRRPVSELSDGERQRAMIARILAQDTGIMLMDEPTAFLDVRGKYQIMNLLHVFSRKNDKTIIFSTHDLHLAISRSDKIWLIINDMLVEGAPEDLIISGSFDHLFDSPPGNFDPEHGIYTFTTGNSGTIHIEGDEELRRWTEKAVMRVGFSLSEMKTDPYITVQSNTGWVLSFRDSSKEFGSVYELVRYLIKVVATSI